ncbi:hypothetical protein Q8F55_001466 [Vanrija albida]|uniref:Aromatic amino acid beta-eliminating lyase/threonine aldolase domain-containing protein n=1 Tax=Vanrija albida TaxID=181172 RepID=A0ABR3QGK4_9TREE
MATTAQLRPAADPADDITESFGGAANVAHLRRVARDFRTDTITMPTDAQVAYAAQASRGDDVEGEDATTTALEERIARLAGKEAALLCLSATMCNALAVRSHLMQPPHSIIVDARAHTFKNEVGGAALFSQATSHALTPKNGLYLVREDIEPELQLGYDVHTAPTRLIMLEDTLNGVVVPTGEVERIAAMAGAHGIPLHVDGARVWNSAAALIARDGGVQDEAGLGAALAGILAPYATASLCLSKGLGAPLGSALVGDRKVIERARWFRKAFGGAWRQSGHVAAQADWALTHHFPRLAATHELARALADGLRAAGCTILAPVDTNMVFFDAAPLGLSFDRVKAALAALDEPITLGSNRLVVHHQTSPRAVADIVETIKALAASVSEEEAAKVRSQKPAELGYR